MKIEKAIVINKEHAVEHDMDFNQDYFRALNLGIEALKRLEELRGYSMTQVDTRLPGETEE